MEKNANELKNKLQGELELYQIGQKSFNKLIQQRQILVGQLNENEAVLEELKLLGDGTKIYKLFGPVLIAQNLEECRGNVGKRMEYILKEANRCTESLETMEKKQDKHRENIQKLQLQYQQLVAKK